MRTPSRRVHCWIVHLSHSAIYRGEEGPLANIRKYSPLRVSVDIRRDRLSPSKKAVLPQGPSRSGACSVQR